MCKATAVPPTRPKSFANCFTADRSSVCPGTRISLCHPDMFIEVKREIMRDVWIIVAALSSRNYLFAEYPRDFLHAEDSDQFLDIIPISVIQRGFNNRLLVEGPVVLDVPDKTPALRDEIVESIVQHMHIITHSRFLLYEKLCRERLYQTYAVAQVWYR